MRQNESSRGEVRRPVPGGTTVVARLSTSETTAHRLTDILSGALDPRDVVVETSEPSRHAWAVAVYFHSIPDQTAIRECVARVAGEKAGEAITFETLTEKDWIAARLAGLHPDRHRERGGAGVRHRPSRHHARLFARA